MSREDDNLPAFPCSYYATPESDQPSFHNGMGLRDWFAGQALSVVAQAIKATDDAEMVARAAYAIADAMLQARKK